MPDYPALAAELTKPAYQGKTDAEAATLLNGTGSPASSPRGVVSSYQVVNVLDPAEFAALTAIQLQRLQVLLGVGNVDLKDDNTRGNLAGIFPNATAPITRAALVTLRTETIPRSKAVEVFGAPVTAQDVHAARS